MYSVIKVKTFEGMEGKGFNATLCRDGRPIAFVIDEGCGGCYLWRWLDKDAELPFKAHVKGMLPKETFEREDMFLGRLIDAFEGEKQIRRWCKKKVVFRLKADKADTYRTLLAPYSAEAAAFVRKKHGEALEEILNERYQKAG